MGPSLCIANKSLGRLMILALGPHSEWQGCSNLVYCTSRVHFGLKRRHPSRGWSMHKESSIK